MKANCLRLHLCLRPTRFSKLVHKKSLVRHENYFRRSGLLTVQHFSDGGAIRAQSRGVLRSTRGALGG